MTSTMILAGVIAIVSLAAIILAAWVVGGSVVGPKAASEGANRNDYESVERLSMPEEIASGSLVISEKTLHRGGPRPLAAKTDQVFRTPCGLLVPVETKARKRVFASDIVQLSCQAAALAEQGVVADYGYVRLAVPGRRPNYQKVKLMPATDIDRLWDRYQTLRLKKAAPIARPAPHRCSRCAFRKGCPSAVSQ